MWYSEHLSQGAKNILAMVPRDAIVDNSCKALAIIEEKIPHEAIADGYSKALATVQENPLASFSVGLAGAAAVVAFSPGIVTGPALYYAGFGADGIVKGSLAAAWHSSSGSVVAPSIFATVQSAGAAGYGTGAVSGAVSTGALAVAGVAAVAGAMTTGAKNAVSSMAAAWQSSIGSVASHSLSATMAVLS
ncbi:hypothetical protein SBRCBS47491_001076 [Sporothrix bragantina]|uniref:Uncharacterized protein n=1 Tax=Sporothrix bragantina TaxID=671064 RepID=A0ABP0AVJ5_9PEZI